MIVSTQLCNNGPKGGFPFVKNSFMSLGAGRKLLLYKRKPPSKKSSAIAPPKIDAQKKEDETSQLIDDFFQLSTRSTASWSPAPYESDTAYLAPCSVWPRKCCSVGRRNLTVMLYCFIFLIPWLLKLQLCSRRTWSENFFSWALSLSLSVFLCEGIWTSD